jgi:hypothetical protein
MNAHRHRVLHQVRRGGPAWDDGPARRGRRLRRGRFADGHLDRVRTTHTEIGEFLRIALEDVTTRKFDIEKVIVDDESGVGAGDCGCGGCGSVGRGALGGRQATEGLTRANVYPT